MLGLVLALGLFNMMFGEIVPAGDGLGWDGVLYGAMVRRLGAMIAHGEISHYYAQRLLPAAIVRTGMLVLGAPFTDAGIVRAFEIYNLVLLAGACLIVRRIADALSFDVAQRWMLFGGIFVNFALSKQAFFLPVLTDVTAFITSLLMLMLYLERRPWPLLAAAIVGAFAWPLISLTGALLLLFPRGGAVGAPVESHVDKRQLRIALICGLAAIAAFVLFALYTATDPRCAVVSDVLSRLPLPGTLRGGLARVMARGAVCETVLGPFTAMPAVIGLMLALASLAGSAAARRALLAQALPLRPLVVARAVAAFLVPILVVRALANPAVADPSSILYLAHLALVPPAGKLLLPLVSLAAYWGPFVLVLVLRWPAFAARARAFGPGFVLVVAITLPFGLVGEPRFLATAWPFLVVGAVLALGNLARSRAFVVTFALLSLALAQFWLPLTAKPWTGGDFVGLERFPKQLYFMHYGLWMGWPAYVAQFASFILAALLLARLVRRHDAPITFA